MTEDRRSRPHTSERPVYNPYSPKKALNPNWIWRQDGDLAMASKPKDLKAVTDMAEANKQSLSSLRTIVGGLILVYDNEHVNYASCFRVGPGIWATARHNLEEELGTDARLQFMYITLDHILPYQRSSIETVLENLTKYFQCTELPLESVSKTLMKCDIDPKSKLQWETSTDFAFLKAEGDEGVDFLLPFAGILNEQDAVAVSGYNMSVSTKYIESTFGSDEFTVQRLTDYFNGFNKKSLSPGQLLSPISPETCYQVPLFPHSCSTLPGSSGSACVWMKDSSYFLAVHVGSWEKSTLEQNNYNLMFSVHHPIFVIEYMSKVYPHLPPERKELVKPYVELHAVHLRQHKIITD